MISGTSDSKKELLYIIKIGGNVIDDEKKLDLFLKDFASIKNNKILQILWLNNTSKLLVCIPDGIMVNKIKKQQPFFRNTDFFFVACLHLIGFFFLEYFPPFFSRQPL